jgi:hypothetical protein
MKAILILIPLMALSLAGCSSGGDEPGPKPVDVNSAEGKKKTEDAINAAPPERREYIRQMIQKSEQQGGGPPPNAKK